MFEYQTSSNTRDNMVTQQVRPWNVTDTAVLTAMQNINREKFVPSHFRHLAYTDCAIPLTTMDESDAQSMLAPKTVGRIVAALNLTGTEKVLEIGTGTGYMTAVLAELVTKVTSLEINPNLAKQAKENLSEEYSNIELIQADGIDGYKAEAPYDAIVISGAFELGIPKIICEQLNPESGRLVGFVGSVPAMQAVLITRTNTVNYTQTTLFETCVSNLINAPKQAEFKF